MSRAPRLRGLKPRIGAAKPRVGARHDGAAPRRSRLSGLYSSAKWRRLRERILERDGWVCQQTGTLLVGIYPAPDCPVVDHIVPHRGDEDLFWDESNLQAVSKGWHDREKQRRERAEGAGAAPARRTRGGSEV